MLTVGELKKLIAEYPDDMEVVLNGQQPEDAGQIDGYYGPPILVPAMEVRRVRYVKEYGSMTESYAFGPEEYNSIKIEGY